jgi:hypothetical protein
MSLPWCGDEPPGTAKPLDVVIADRAPMWLKAGFPPEKRPGPAVVMPGVAAILLAAT